MAKRPRKPAPKKNLEVPADIQEAPAADTPEPKEAPEPTVYAYPSRSRCPRCGGMNTRARYTKLGVQYRECCGAVCRYRYAVLGVEA